MRACAVLVCVVLFSLLTPPALGGTTDGDPPSDEQTRCVREVLACGTARVDAPMQCTYGVEDGLASCTVDALWHFSGSSPIGSPGEARWSGHASVTACTAIDGGLSCLTQQLDTPPVGCAWDALERCTMEASHRFEPGARPLGPDECLDMHVEVGMVATVFWPASPGVAFVAPRATAEALVSFQGGICA